MRLPGVSLIEGTFEPHHMRFKYELNDFLKENSVQIEAAQKLDTFPRSLYKKFAEAGFLGLNFPVSLGGRGLDTTCCVILIEEVAKISSSIAGIITTAGITGPYLILREGSEEQRKKYLPLVCKGELIVSFAITEPNAGSDVTYLSTYAAKDGDFYIINGTKTFITHAPIADLFLITARTGERRGQCTVFIVEKNTPGLSVSEKMKKLGWWCQETGEVYLSEVKVHKSQILGAKDAGLRVPMVSINLTRILLSATALGLSERILRNALINVVQSSPKSVLRKQFVRASLSRLISEWVAVRALLYKIAHAVDKGTVTRAETSILKLLATELAKKITQECLWMFGYASVDKFSDFSICYLDAPVFTIADGTSEIQLENVARELGLLEKLGQT
ncbi:MAG: acyl-CoA dehydrogenase family protein [Candidatus Bathyarchaeia archaeon]